MQAEIARDARERPGDSFKVGVKLCTQIQV